MKADYMGIKCPFCGATVIWAEVYVTDADENGYGDYLNDERDTDYCEHVIFADAWCDDGFETYVNSGDKQLDARILEVNEEYCPDSEEMICDLVAETLPGGAYEEIAWEGGHIELGVGPHGGGPAYTAVFLKRKTKSPGRRRPRKGKR